MEADEPQSVRRRVPHGQGMEGTRRPDNAQPRSMAPGREEVRLIGNRGGMTGPGRLATVLLLLTAAAGLHCGNDEASNGQPVSGKGPVLRLLADRADYKVELKGFADKRGEWDEKIGVILSIFVINDSDITLPQLTVRLRRFGPSSADVPLETRRLTIDVSEIATNRSGEIIIAVDGFIPGPLDGLTVDLEILPPEEEYGEFPELADALAARQTGDQP